MPTLEITKTVVITGRGKYIRPPNLKGLTGSWSKWGGNRVSVYQDKIQDYWYCQSCGEKEPKEITPFLYDLDKDENDYVRVCAVCFSNDCGLLIRHKTRSSYDDILKEICPYLF